MEPIMPARQQTKPLSQMVRSGTTTERLLRAAFLAVVISGFAAAFLWDGFFGYPRENAESLVKSLGLSATTLPAIDSKLTAENGRELVDRIPKHASASQAKDMLGEPALLSGDDAYYLGPAGHIKARSSDGRIVSIEWVDGPAHTATDLNSQRWIGYALGLFGMVALGQLVRVGRTQALLSDEGLRVRGKPFITIAAMTGIRDKRASGGTLEIEYRDGETTETVALDAYVYRNRDAIIEAVCTAKGFVNPLQSNPAPSEP